MTFLNLKSISLQELEKKRNAIKEKIVEDLFILP